LLAGFDCKVNGQSFTYKTFETRFKAEAPDLTYDIYISSGGPGSPFNSEGTVWEKKYFKLLEKLWNHNQSNDRKNTYSLSVILSDDGKVFQSW